MVTFSVFLENCGLAEDSTVAVNVKKYDNKKKDGSFVLQQKRVAPMFLSGVFSVLQFLVTTQHGDTVVTNPVTIWGEYHSRNIKELHTHGCSPCSAQNGCLNVPYFLSAIKTGVDVSIEDTDIYPLSVPHHASNLRIAWTFLKPTAKRNVWTADPRHPISDVFPLDVDNPLYPVVSGGSFDVDRQTADLARRLAGMSHDEFGIHWLDCNQRLIDAFFQSEPSPDFPLCFEVLRRSMEEVRTTHPRLFAYNWSHFGPHEVCKDFIATCSAGGAEPTRSQWTKFSIMLTQHSYDVALGYSLAQRLLTAPVDEDRRPYHVLCGNAHVWFMYVATRMFVPIIEHPGGCATKIVAEISKEGTHPACLDLHRMEMMDSFPEETTEDALFQDARPAGSAVRSVTRKANFPGRSSDSSTASQLSVSEGHVELLQFISDMIDQTNSREGFLKHCGFRSDRATIRVSVRRRRGGGARAEYRDVVPRLVSGVGAVLQFNVVIQRSNVVFPVTIWGTFRTRGAEHPFTAGCPDCSALKGCLDVSYFLAGIRSEVGIALEGTPAFTNGEQETGSNRTAWRLLRPTKKRHTWSPDPRYVDASSNSPDIHRMSFLSDGPDEAFLRALSGAGAASMREYWEAVNQFMLDKKIATNPVDFKTAYAEIHRTVLRTKRDFPNIYSDCGLRTPRQLKTMLDASMPPKPGDGAVFAREFSTHAFCIAVARETLDRIVAAADDYLNLRGDLYPFHVLCNKSYVVEIFCAFEELLKGTGLPIEVNAIGSDHAKETACLNLDTLKMEAFRHPQPTRASQKDRRPFSKDIRRATPPARSPGPQSEDESTATASTWGSSDSANERRRQKRRRTSTD